MISINDKNKEKFFVENLLENHKFNRKRRKCFGKEDPIHKEEDEEQVIQCVIPIKKPNLKYGIDSILKQPKEEHNFQPLIKCMNISFFNLFFF